MRCFKFLFGTAACIKSIRKAPTLSVVGAFVEVTRIGFKPITF